MEPLNKPSQIFSRGKKVNIVGFSLLSIMILSSHNLPLFFPGTHNTGRNCELRLGKNLQRILNKDKDHYDHEYHARMIIDDDHN